MNRENIKNHPEFIRQLAKMNEAYDEDIKMYRHKLSSPGYHTTITEGFVHGTREALRHALLLLNEGSAESAKRASDIIEATISLQDQNPENDTYGI